MLSIVLTLALTGSSSTALLPQTAKPDFSGRWVLDIAKSEFGASPAPKERVDEIKQTARRLDVVRTVTLEGGPRKLELTFDLTGAPTKQAGMIGELTATAAWKGRQLVTTAKGKNPDGGDITLTDTWELSADGKTLTINRSILGPATNQIRFVFARK